MSYGDDSALEQARGGDSDAFRVLVERHATAVFRLAYRMTGNETDAEDMVQETFLRAWREIRRFDGRASFGTWLHRICANRTVDFLRSRNRWQAAATPGESEEHDPFRHLSSGSPSPERAAQSAQAGGTNKSLVALEAIAKERNIDNNEAALAWLLTRSPVMLPIPGTSQVKHLEDNVGAAKIKLTPEEMARVS